MNKTELQSFNDKISEIVKDFEASLTICDQLDSFDYEFEFWTSYGGDFILDIVVNPDFSSKDFIEELTDYTEGFDVDYEAYLWLGPDGHGKNGAPYRMRTVLDEQEERLELLQDFLKAVKNEFEE